MSVAVRAHTVGETLSETYRLERVLAEGGMGIVYEAQHLRLPKRFAVKVLGAGKDAGLRDTARQRFRREAEIASSLSHPHIVEVVDYRADDHEAPYLVMELLAGEDLAERLRRVRRLPVEKVAEIVEGIAAALDVAHERGVVHRDLKPANIFLAHIGGKEDFVKVLDFGVSKLVDSASLTHDKAMVGTPLYMSPEQAVGRQQSVTPHSDVFSLATIAYEMLTGKRAFAAASVPSILYQIVHGPTPSFANHAPALAASLDPVFARALRKKPEERYARASEFAADLKKALANAPAELRTLPGLTPATGVPAVGATATGAATTDVDEHTADDDAERAAGLDSLEQPLTPARARWLAPALAATVLTAFAIGGALWWRSAHQPLPPAAGVALAPPPTAPLDVVNVTPLTAPPPRREEPPPPPARRVTLLFRVQPPSAHITVDGKAVRGARLELAPQSAARHVHLAAPGRRALELDIPGDRDHTLAVQLEHARGKSPAPPRAPSPTHSAAPVQDL